MSFIDLSIGLFFFIMQLQKKKNEKDLMSQKKETLDTLHCPQGCPFLEINYFEETQKIPYHCELFNTFLAFDGDIIRCSECVGHEHSIKEQGLNFINAYQGDMVNRNVTKLGFAKLFPAAQKQFVTFMKKFGFQVGVPSSIQSMSLKNLDKVQKYLLQELNKNVVVHESRSGELQEIEDILKKNADSDPEIIDKKSCQLILNLYQVLDISERLVLKNILKNPNLCVLFIAKVRFMPKNMDLLKNVRKEMERFYPDVQAEINAPILPKILQNTNQNVK